ncbi:MAG: bifunctional riboflavin kinase/FAD synthetase [Nitrospirae bacterium]|nr:bifunctional riboflavin kinase/FAD synthetase [Nitrospirota bacterium]
MELIKGIESLKETYPNTVVTIGNFDGLHLGHQKILKEVIKLSEELKGTSIVVTFDPHPVKVLAPDKEIKLLTTLKERSRLMEAFGIKVLLCINFNKEFSNLLPDDFIEGILVKKLHIIKVIVGHNYAFGKERKGTTELLRRRGRKFGFGVKVVRNAKVDGEVVSSSKIRNHLLKGKVYEAANLLGRAYSIEGNVVKGTGRGGSILHIPTANITTPNELVPKEGVYAVMVGFKDKFYEGVANIGGKPTFGDSQTSYEVHLLNFSRNLLGEHLRIYFIDWIRNQRFFPDAMNLEKQIREDIGLAKEILSMKRPKLI